VLFSAFASSYSEGFIGIYVASYLGGFIEQTVVDQQNQIWNDKASLYASDTMSGSNTGSSQIATFPVDSLHWYALWVWCGGSISGDGWGLFSGSGASSSINVTVPAIAWELY
jgi:hypothetical protein